MDTSQITTNTFKATDFLQIFLLFELQCTVYMTSMVPYTDKTMLSPFTELLFVVNHKLHPFHCPNVNLPKSSSI